MPYAKPPDAVISFRKQAGQEIEKLDKRVFQKQAGQSIGNGCAAVCEIQVREMYVREMYVREMYVREMLVREMLREEEFAKR